VTARAETYQLMRDLERHPCGIPAITFEDANTLRRAQITLHRWAELECGYGNDYRSWAIERDEQTGIAYMATYPHDGTRSAYRIPDRERGALARVAAVCARYGAFYYHQTDPRGCALYVSSKPIPDNDYNRQAVACAV